MEMMIGDLTLILEDSAWAAHYVLIIFRRDALQGWRTRQHLTCRESWGYDGGLDIPVNAQGVRSAQKYERHLLISETTRGLTPISLWRW